MAAIPADLPSRVEESFAACPQFRIVVIGNTGVGKSSLVSSVFNISLSLDLSKSASASASAQINVSHDGAGKADITRAYSSAENPRFVLHDSMGFEHGFLDKWNIVEKFLRDRTNHPELKERVHAIWLCIETPRTGARVLQTGDEKLLSLAKELQIPVIAVFTKYDMLVKEQFRRLPKASKMSPPEKKLEAERLAEADFPSRIQTFRSSTQMRVPCVRVSTNKDYLRKTLLELTDVTRGALPDFGGRLWLPWGAAQQVSANQKVELSISEGFKKYWLNLGAGTFFKDRALNQCIARIHDDILKVWNFNDPEALLSGDKFKAEITRYGQPLLNEPKSPGGNKFSPINFVYQKCQKLPLTARYLGAYIVELILVLHHLFTEMIRVPPPRTLTWGQISSALDGHDPTMSARIHSHLKIAAPDSHPPLGVEQKVADLIRKLLDLN